MANGKVCDACANGPGHQDIGTTGLRAARTSDASAATTTTACK